MISRSSQLFARSEYGGAALELVVVLPVLVLLAIGVAEFGRVYLTSIAVANAATAGAEYASLNSGINDAAIIQQARNDANDQTLSVTPVRRCRCPGSESPVSCTALPSPCGAYGTPQYFIEVTATKTVNLLFRYPGLPSSVTVTKMSAFRVQ